MLRLRARGPVREPMTNPSPGYINDIKRKNNLVSQYKSNDRYLSDLP